MTEAWIIDACRTPARHRQGRQGRAVGASSAAARLDRPQGARRAQQASTPPKSDDVIWGTHRPGRPAGRRPRPHVGARRRLRRPRQRHDPRPLLRLGHHRGESGGRACIISGMEDLVVAGGTEMMSMGSRPCGDGPMIMDNGNLHLRCITRRPHQGVCADAIATLEGITREDARRTRLRPASSARPSRSRTATSTRAWSPVYTRGRHARARPRGISASADDARRPRRRSRPLFAAHRRMRRSTTWARPIAR